jgi:hypothetical protein
LVILDQLFFRIYLDTDNNPLTGLNTDSFGGALPVDGAEYILEINAKNNSTFRFTLELVQH